MACLGGTNDGNISLVCLHYSFSDRHFRYKPPVLLVIMRWLWEYFCLKHPGVSCDNGTVSPQRETRVLIGKTTYLLKSDDEYLDHFRAGFEPDTVALLTTLGKESRVILDIGANIGCTALLFGELSEIVHAFEPSPTTFCFLEENIVQSPNHNIIAHNYGIGSDPGIATLTFAPSNRSCGFISDKIQASRGHTLESVVIKRLDDEICSLAVNHLDLIKIDVEGYEEHVLRGAEETLKTFEPVVVLELNHWCLNAFQRASIPDFFDYLRSLFPILLAVDDTRYLDLHDESDRYIVMYHHILHMRYLTIVACFDESQLKDFRSRYTHGLPRRSLWTRLHESAACLRG